VSETDPFSDSAFAGRLQKLLPMLGSEQPGEADAARRKLIEHLGQHRLSLVDLAARLREQPRSGFLQGAHEMQLERQLAVAREARQDAANEALTANMRMRAMEAELRQSNMELTRLVVSQARVRIWASLATVVCGGLILVASVPFLTGTLPAHRARATEPSFQTGDLRGPVDRAMTSPPSSQQSLDAVANGALRVGAAEVAGSAAVQDLPVRLSPNDQATIRAFLNRGEPVAIQTSQRIGNQTWLLIRTSTVAGWARSGDVLR
jgi:hypothetical protein